MNDISTRVTQEFSEFLIRIEEYAPKPLCNIAYEITLKSTFVSALLMLDAQDRMDAHFWNHLQMQRNILDYLYTLWLDDDRTLLEDFSAILIDLVEYDVSVCNEHLKEEVKIA